MKLNLYIFLFILLNISITKSAPLPCSYDSIQNQLICSQKEINLLAKIQTVDYVIPGSLNNGNISFDILNFPYVDRVCTQILKDLSRFSPQRILSFPNVSTIGGKVHFKQSFGCDQKRDFKAMFINSAIANLSYTLEDSYSVTLLPGCGNISIIGEGNLFLATAHYKLPTITDRGFKDGKYFFYGTNLFGSEVTIEAQEGSPLAIVSPVVTPISNGETHSSIEFDFPEAQYTGIWKIQLSICGESQNSYVIDQKPFIEKISPLTIAEKGGDMTITGRNFNGGKNVATTVIFGIDKDRQCIVYEPINSTVIICNVPARSNKTGYDLPLFVNVGSFSSGTKYFSYNLPRILSITQVGTTDAFKISGVFLNQAIALRYAKNENASHEIKLNQNMTITNETLIDFILPRNAQQGYLALLIPNNDADNSTYVSPPIDLEIIPTIEDKIIESDTTGSEVTLTGYFLQIYKYGDMLIPLKISGPGGSKQLIASCKDFKNGDKPGFSFKCTISPGVGVNYKLNVMYRTTHVTDITLNYRPPTINTFAVMANGQLQVTGTNLGDDPTLVKFRLSTEPNGTKFTEFNAFQSEHTSASFNIDGSKNNVKDFETGYIWVIVDGRNTTAIPYRIEPVIEKINSVPTYGGIVTITGHYFSLFPGFPEVFTSVSLGQSNCPVRLSLDETIECDLTGTLSTQYSNFTSGVNKTIKINGDENLIRNPNRVKFDFYAPQVTGYTNISTDGVLTIFGFSFNDNKLSISVGGKPCINPQVVDILFRTISCVIGTKNESSTAKEPIKYDLIVEVDGLVGKNSSFIYVFDPQGPPPSEPYKLSLPNAIYIGLGFFFIFFIYVCGHAWREYQDYAAKKKLAKRLARDAEAQSAYHEKHKNNAKLTRKFTKIELMPEPERKGWDKFKHSIYGWVHQKSKIFKRFKKSKN